MFYVLLLQYMRDGMRFGLRVVCLSITAQGPDMTGIVDNHRARYKIFLLIPR